MTDLDENLEFIRALLGKPPTHDGTEPPDVEQPQAADDLTNLLHLFHTKENQ